MNNTKMSSAAHGLNVMKTLMPTLSSKAQNASSGMSFAETLISVRTRVQTVSVTTTRTSTEMTMTEYKSYIYGKISDLPVNPTQANRAASVFISDEGFAAMKDSSEYEDWVLGKLREDFALSNPLCARTGSYVVYQFGAKRSEYRGDSWYSELFRSHMSEDHNHQFRIAWLKECASRGITKVWISIDGSNNDCNVAGSDLCEKGAAKSHTNSDIVSFIWALDARTGTPVTYFVNNGGMVDSKAFQKIAAFLASSSIEIDGVILDRGFCTHDVLQTLEECGYPYVVMLKSDTYGHTKMMEKHAASIKWNVRYIAGDDGLFGISEKQQVFGNHPEEAWVNLYFDGANGTDRSITLIRKIRTAAREMEEAILNHEKPSVPKELSHYVSARKNGRSWKVVYNYENWQKALDEKGFCSIASSLELNPEMVNRLYHLRDVSEKQYMIMKSQLGYDTTRVHTTEGIESKFAVCFIASVIRSEICNACKKLGLDSNRMIREIDRIVLVLMTDGLYASVNNLSIRQNDLLAAFGIQPGHFKVFADDVNHRRINPINSQVHRLPEDEQAPKKKRGRPPKKRLTDEISLPTPKRKPGRPKGSKNKKTLEREARLLQEPQPVKRKPGRPKGSKNKPKETITPKRRRGRPRKDSSK